MRGAARQQGTSEGRANSNAVSIDYPMAENPEVKKFQNTGCNLHTHRFLSESDLFRFMRSDEVDVSELSQRRAKNCQK
jgi:hypothetical protein